MSDIDFSDLKLIDDFMYDIQPNEKGEMMLAFKVGDKSCVLPIPLKDLKSLLWYAEQGAKK
jgi:hypothetical protein